MNEITLTKTHLEVIYNILVKTCGATLSEKHQFIYKHQQPNPPVEWRFGGVFGLSGKFGKNNGRIYISGDSTNPSHAAIVEAVNEQLLDIFTPWLAAHQSELESLYRCYTGTSDKSRSYKMV